MAINAASLSVQYITNCNPWLADAADGLTD